jgi:hypothetical protein
MYPGETLYREKNLSKQSPFIALIMYDHLKIFHHVILLLKSLPSLPRPDWMTCRMLRYFADKYLCYIPALWRKLFCCLFWTDIPALLWADIAASYGLLLLPSMDWYTAFYGLIHSLLWTVIPLCYGLIHAPCYSSVMDWYITLLPHSYAA